MVKAEVEVALSRISLVYGASRTVRLDTENEEKIRPRMIPKFLAQVTGETGDGME